MADLAAFAERHALSRIDALRAAIVYGCALALIAAGHALPF